MVKLYLVTKFGNILGGYQILLMLQKGATKTYYGGVIHNESVWANKWFIIHFKPYFMTGFKLNTIIKKKNQIKE